MTASSSPPPARSSSVPPGVLRPIEPGDVVDADARLREVMNILDNGAYALNVSFTELGPEVEAEAQKMRHTLQLAATRVVTLIKLIEKHPIYLAASQKEEDQDG